MSKSTHTSHANELRGRAEQMATWLVAHPLTGQLGELDSTRLMHELQVHHVELEMQNAELRQARSEVDAALEKAKVEIEHLRKSGILNTMCNEMQTPLQVIADMAQQLRALGLDAEQTKRLDKLHKASKKLQAMVLASIEPTVKPANQRARK
jgi:hypothetical protein